MIRTGPNPFGAKAEPEDLLSMEQGMDRFLVDGIGKRARLPYGDIAEGYGRYGASRCECGARMGWIHLYGCPVERCPVCHELAVECPHELVGLF